MTPQSKKRKHPQSTTLHNFFSPDAIATKKGKTLRPAPQTKGKPRNTTRPSEEVIIIDSDSDGHVSMSKKKGKEKQRSESSQVESVGEPAVVAGPSNHTLKDNRTSKSVGSSFGTTERFTGNSVAGKSKICEAILDDEDISFGEPSLLLPSSTSSVVKEVAQTVSFEGSIDLLRPRKASSTSEPPLFGLPTALLCDTYHKSASELSYDIPMQGDFLGAHSSVETADDSGSSRPSTYYPIQETISSSLTSSVKGLDDDDDDWATGDDEMALIDPELDDHGEEDMERVEFESSSPEAMSSLQEDADGVTTCPICALHLVGLFMTVGISMFHIMLKADHDLCRRFKIM
jgi:hypothetical protein